MNYARHTSHDPGRFLKRTMEKPDTLVVVAVLLLMFVGFLITRGATPASSELSYVAYSPLGEEAGSVVPASCDSRPLPGSHFDGDCVARCPSGGGYYDLYFDPGATACFQAPANPIVCVANVGQTCYLENSCGQKSAAGVIGCDGTCGNKYETTELTPSGRFLGTWDDFRYGPAGVCSNLVGKDAVAGNSYACAPNLNVNSGRWEPGEGSDMWVPETIYYAESRHNGNWGNYTYGENWCQETGVRWVECGPALAAPPNSSCPSSPTSPSSPSTPTTPTTPVTPTPPPASVSPDAVTASITATSPVAYGDHSTLTWRSTNATSCTAGGDWSNLNPDSGTQFNGSGWTLGLIADATFTFQCTGSDGRTASDSVTVGVLPSTCDNGANNPFQGCSQCPDGQAYDTATNSCVECGGNPAGCSSGTGGGGSASNPTGSLVCNSGANNPPGCDVYTPTATLSANPKTLDVGQSTALTWSSTNATSCSGDGFSTGDGNTRQSPPGGVSSRPLTTPGPVPFILTCTGPGGEGTDSDSVTVLDPSAEISVSRTRVPPTDPTVQVSWSANGVLSCVVTGPSGTFASGPSDEDTFSFPAGSRSVVIEGQSTFVIRCRTNGDDVVRSATVNILTVYEEF